METPSSSRRVTRSQTSAAFNSSIRVEGKEERSGKSSSKTRTGNGKHKQERSALIDITNDSSPIVGLAMETPSSSVAGGGKERSIGAKNMMMMTPGSGEALLRCQIKTLLRKVEEEAEVSKLPLASRPFFHLQSSPVGLVAPANTPQVLNGSEDAGLMDLPVVQEQLNISEVVVSGKFESQNYVITRSLLMDFAEKSDGGDGEISATKEETLGFPDDEHDDDASVWSIQVNASTHDEDEETFEEMEDDYHEDEEEEYDDGSVDELCKSVSKMSMTETFIGRRHTRFVYNSDGEIEEESDDCSSHILPLKGLPTPKGKHLRLPLEEEESDDGSVDELCKSVSKMSMTETFIGRRHTRFVYNSDGEIEEESDDCLSHILPLKGLPTPKGKHLRFPLEEEDP